LSRTATCRCPAYPFPHRAGGGACHARDGWGPVCTACLRPCTVEVQDVGRGPYECWGERGVHTERAPVSACCGAEVVDAETGAECGWDIYDEED